MEKKMNVQALLELLERRDYHALRAALARENEADLIVMAHHSSDLSDDDADIGSTVEQVVLRSACPVASVTRPEAR